MLVHSFIRTHTGLEALLGSVTQEGSGARPRVKAMALCCKTGSSKPAWDGPAPP